MESIERFRFGLAVEFPLEFLKLRFSNELDFLKDLWRLPDSFLRVEKLGLKVELLERDRDLN